MKTLTLELPFFSVCLRQIWRASKTVEEPFPSSAPTTQTNSHIRTRNQEICLSAEKLRLSFPTVS